MKKLIRLFLLSCFVVYLSAVILSFVPNLANKLVLQSNSYGDLFEMSKIRDFKIALPRNLPVAKNDSISDASIIVMGDSFFNVSPGYSIFADQIRAKTNLKVHNYNIQGSGELWRKTNPLDYVQDINGTIPRILILESVDRGIEYRYLTIKRETVNTKPTRIPRIISDCNSKLNVPNGSIDSYEMENNRLKITGWAIGSSSDVDIKKITFLLDKREISGSLQKGLARQDVSAYFNKPDLLNSGYTFISAPIVTKGNHTLTAVIENTCGRTYQTNPKLVSTRSNIGDAIIKQLDSINNGVQQRIKSIDFILLNNPVSESVSELVATARFHIYGDISGLTPRFSYNPKMLFYKDEIQHFEKKYSGSEISQIADNIKYISDELKRTYNARLIFVPMPNKYVLYHKRAGENRDEIFLPNLYSALKARNVEYVNLLDKFIGRTNDTLYLPSDTHLDFRGMKIMVDEVILKLGVTP